jgi:hypothetical protein
MKMKLWLCFVLLYQKEEVDLLFLPNDRQLDLRNLQNKQHRLYRNMGHNHNPDRDYEYHQHSGFHTECLYAAASQMLSEESHGRFHLHIDNNLIQLIHRIKSNLNSLSIQINSKKSNFFNIVVFAFFPSSFNFN